MNTLFGREIQGKFMIQPTNLHMVLLWLHFVIQQESPQENLKRQVFVFLRDKNTTKYIFHTNITNTFSDMAAEEKKG